MSTGIIRQGCRLYQYVSDEVRQQQISTAPALIESEQLGNQWLFIGATFNALQTIATVRLFVGYGRLQTVSDSSD